MTAVLAFIAGGLTALGGRRYLVRGRDWLYTRAGWSRCASCNNPTHPNDILDDGRCARCWQL